MNGEVCVLDDGRRVRFSLKKRERDPCFLVSFKGPCGGRKERSTKETNKKRAADAAINLIREAFTPRVLTKKPTWDEAISVMTRRMEADNLRPKTIQQYLLVVSSLRRAFPEVLGPAGITPEMASRYKAMRREAGVGVRTIKGNLDNLGIVYNKWWIKEGHLLEHDPFADVTPPKADNPTPRLITPGEVQAFLDWMDARWDGWRLPRLFLEVNSLVGCRITELASAKKSGLKEGRLHFEAVTTKGRKERAVRLPPPVFEELARLPGRTYVFEAFSDQLRGLHLAKGRPHHAKRVRGYTPERLKDWMENQAVLYFEARPEARKFKLHNLRGTAMSVAKMAGVSFEDAAIAFGRHPATMREHYLALDETAISDRGWPRSRGPPGWAAGSILRHRRSGPSPTRPPDASNVGRNGGDDPLESTKDLGLVALSPLILVPKRGLEPPRAWLAH